MLRGRTQTHICTRVWDMYLFFITAPPHTNIRDMVRLLKITATDKAGNK
jgi:hypothetical protein